MVIFVALVLVVFFVHGVAAIALIVVALVATVGEMYLWMRLGRRSANSDDDPP